MASKRKDRGPVARGGKSSSNARELPARRVVSTGMAERLAERSAMARHRLQVRIAVVAGLVLAVGAAIWVVLFSPVLALDAEQVTISGQGTVIDVDEVADLVAVERDTPLPRLDTVGLRERIMKLNGVKDVAIRRSWPRGLHVALVSREPVAVIPVEDSYALVDVEAVAVASVNEPPAELPVIGIPWTDGEAPPRPLHAALIILAAASPELLAELADVSATTEDNVEMVLRDGTRVLWGGSQDAALKVKVFSTLRSLPENAGVTVYDVSAPTTPVTR